MQGESRTHIVSENCPPVPQARDPENEEHKAASHSSAPSNYIGLDRELITPKMLSLVELDQQQIDIVLSTVPGGAANVQDIYWLSPLQEGLLFQHLLNEQSDTLVLSTLFQLHADTQIGVLTKALQKVIDRHDTLRTAVVWEKLQRPVQVVYRHATLPVEELVLDQDGDVIEQLKGRMKPGHQRISLRQAPLMRLQVVTDARGERWFALLQIHHMVCDLVSWNVVVAEAIACIQGREGELLPVVSYRDYVAWALAHAETQDAEAFFCGKLGEIDEPTAPFGLLDVHGDGNQIEEARQALEPALSEQVRIQARRLGVSAARLFHAAWALVVAHTSGRDDVVFGTVLLAAWQRSARAHVMLGMAVNTLPLRLMLKGLTAKELVEHTHQELSELLNYEQAPLALAQRCSGISGTAPLFTALLNYRRNIPDSEVGGIRMVARRGVWTNYPITLLVDDLGEGFVLTAQTDRRIDPHRVTGYLQTAICSLVEALEQMPQRLALTLSILPKDERHQIIDQFNATQRIYPHEKLIHELFEEQVQRTPDAVAVVYGSHSLTYAELNAKANQLARYLRGKGVRPDQLVGICVERSLEMVVGLLGILKAGGAYVPLDPGQPPERLQYMVSTAAPCVLLIQEELKSRLPVIDASIVALDSDSGEIGHFEDGNLDARSLGLTSSHLAYVIFTSGSTGKPKGAMNEHRALINRLHWMQNQYQLGSSDRVLQKTPFSFDVSVWEFFWPLMSGARLIVARPQGHQDPAYLRQLIERAEITTLHFVPSMLQIFLDQHQDGWCPSVRHIVCSGEELSPALQNRCLGCIPQARLSNLYGPTEAAIDVTFWECQRDEHSKRVPIGRPISNTQMYVLNGDLQPVPIGVAGEIYIGGIGVGRGYLNRPELTSERFVRDIFSSDPQARLYKTGDQGQWRSDGAIEYLGRNDHQVKIRGFRIELGEIEAQLIRHEQVREAVVIAREDVPGEKCLVAYVVPRDPLVPSVDALRVHLKAVLPDYMVPSAFVVIEGMPLSPNGKLDRRALPPPEFSAYGSRQYEAPQGEVEEILAGIWQGLLRLERVGRRDNFFELGGHSLLVVQMMERLHRVGLSTEMRRVFESPDLAELASALSNEVVEQFEVPPNLIPRGCEAITPEMLPLVELDADQIKRIVRSVPGGAANVQDIYPLTPLQEGILFHHLLNERGGDTYILPLVLSVSSGERLDELVAALNAVIARHDILRTAVLWEDLQRPVQVVWRHASLPLERVALNPECDLTEQIKEWLKPERHRLNLQQAPLMRLQVAEDARNGQWYAVLQLHHMTIDHVTLEIVTSEIVSHLEGRAQQLSESEPYRNHVAQALAYAATHDEETFFRSKLAQVDEPTAPFGLLDIRGDGSQIEEGREELDPALAQSIRREARRLSVSSATLFHAAWGLVVAHTSGRADVVFGSVLLGRLQSNAKAQRILGMFINTLPLRLQLQGVTVKELVEHTQRELVELLSHEQASLAVAQRCSGVVGSLPVFTALLNYRHSVPNPGAEWASAKGIRLLAIQERTNYPITLSVDDLGEGFTLKSQTDQRIDPLRVTAYLRTALQSIVAALQQAPQGPALALSILPESERRQVLASFNATQITYPQEKLLHEMFEEQVQRSPNALAVVCSDKHLTYAQVNDRANQLANVLLQYGVRPDDFIAIYLERGVEMIVALLAVLKAGGAYLPLDISYPVERLTHMLRDSAPAMLLTQRRLKGTLSLDGVHVLALDEDEDRISSQPCCNLDRARLGLQPRHLAYLIYTSGSTGVPKGVMVEHRSVVNLVHWHRIAFDLREGDRSSCVAAVGFDAAVWEIWPPLAVGATLALAPSEVVGDPDAFLAWWASQPLDVSFLPTPMAELAFSRSIHNPSLRKLLVGGDRLSYRPKSLAFALINNYGPTESTVVATSGCIHDEDTVLHIGRPIANTQAYVLDQDRGPVPIGVSGELYIGGVGVARGYLNRPELEPQRFMANPFSVEPEARMYRTGDLARWRIDGTLEFIGRNDEQVKIRGYRIELAEIEAQLARHDQVSEAVVVVREDVPGAKRLVAYVVRRDESGPKIEDLRARLKSMLPDYMVPSAFVIMKSLPLTLHGKVDRRALPAPEHDSYDSQQYEAPKGEVEQALAGIWQELLGVKRVGRHQNFFELGGHSILAVGLLLKINQSFGCTLRITEIYKNPTVRDLSARICGDTSEDKLLNLSQEAALDDEIVAKPGLRQIPDKAVLLTGGTGFVGRFLLAQLLQDTDATIYCLVRAQSKQHAWSRLRTNLMKWDLWRDEFEPRIVAVQGDLRLPHLGIDPATYEGLCQDIGSIYHCATSMNHLETYAMAKSANVDAARELVKLATHHRPKLINHISTLGIFVPTGTPRVVNEGTPIEQEVHRSSQGYVSSKWVGEKIFMIASERGIPCNIFRLGLIWADTELGRYDELQRAYRVFKSCLLSGYGIKGYQYDMAPTPVDYAARAVVFLAKSYADGHGIFHISSGSQGIQDVFGRCNEIAGTSLELVSFYEWVCAIKRLHHEGMPLPVVPLVQYAFSMDEKTFLEHERAVRSTSIRFNCDRTHRELEGAGIVAPVLNDRLLTLYVGSMFSRDKELRELVSRRNDLKFTRRGSGVPLDGLCGSGLTSQPSKHDYMQRSGAMSIKGRIT